MKLEKGFTMVELVIVIVIMGILSIIAIPVYKNHIEQTKIRQAAKAAEEQTSNEEIKEEIIETEDDISISEEAAKEIEGAA
jgi:prepilin-type N-terminal cleavage/methylation domain-containing protein